MGEPWNEEELQIFLENFRNDGIEKPEIMREQLLQKGYKRTIENLQSVFLKNKNFLKFHSKCSSEEFAAIMADHYENYQMEIKTTPVKNQEQQNQFQNIPSSKKKKSNIKRKKSLEIHKIEEKTIKLEENTEKFVRKRKIKGKFLVDLENEANIRIKTIETLTRNCTGKNPKKQLKKSQENINYNFVKCQQHEYFYSHIDKPYFEQNEFKDMLEKVELQDIQEGLKKKEWNLIRKAMGKPRRFSKNFIQGEIKKLNVYRQVVRYYLQDPSNYSLDDKINDLKIREKVKKLVALQVSQPIMAVHPICGHFHQGTILTQNIGNNGLGQIIVKFQIGDLGVQKISDTNLSLDFCVIKEQDDPIKIVESSVKKNSEKKEAVSQPQFSKNQQQIIQELDYFATALLIKLLDRKKILIQQLKYYNDIVQKDRSQLNEQLQQEYGWTGVLISKIDDSIKHVLAKFRLRGNSKEDSQIITQNLDKLLEIPLNNIEQQMVQERNLTGLQFVRQILQKQHESSISVKVQEVMREYYILKKQEKQNQQQDQNEQSENQIQEEVNLSEKQKDGENKDEQTQVKSDQNIEKIEEEEEIIDQKTKQSDAQKLESLIEDDMDSLKEKNLQNLIFNCLGILQSFYQSGEINSLENSFIRNLYEDIQLEYKEEINEIHDALQNINTRINI